MDPRTLRQRHLRGQVGGRAKAVDPESAARWQVGAAQRPETDNAGAQERRQLTVGVALRQPVGVVRADDGVLGITAVGIPTGVAGDQTQVLRAAPAVGAGPVGLPQPGDPEPVTGGDIFHLGADGVDIADHLVPGNRVGSTRPEVAFGEMQVCTADPARRDPQTHLAGSGFGHGQGRAPQRSRRRRCWCGDLPGGHHGRHTHDFPRSTATYRSHTVAIGGRGAGASPSTDRLCHAWCQMVTPWSRARPPRSL